MYCCYRQKEMNSEVHVYVKHIKQFQKLDKDLTKIIETKLERAVRRIKDYLSTSEYGTLYPSGSAPRNIKLQ